MVIMEELESRSLPPVSTINWKWVKRVFTLAYAACLIYTYIIIHNHTPLWVPYWLYGVDIIGLIILPACIESWDKEVLS